MVRFELLLDDRTIHTIDYKSFSKNETSVNTFIRELETIKIENQENQQSSAYLGMHMERVKSMLPLIYAHVGAIILIDIYWLFARITNAGFQIDLKIQFLNSLFIYFIPYLKKFKSKKAGNNLTLPRQKICIFLSNNH